jgi:hypothetical protein
VVPHFPLIFASTGLNDPSAFTVGGKKMNRERSLLSVDTHPDFHLRLKKQVQFAFDVEKMEAPTAAFQTTGKNEGFMLHAFLPSRDAKTHWTTTGGQNGLDQTNFGKKHRALSSHREINITGPNSPRSLNNNGHTSCRQRQMSPSRVLNSLVWTQVGKMQEALDMAAIEMESVI